MPSSIKILKFIFSTIIIILFSNCKNESKNIQVKKPIKKTIKIKEIVKKEWDSINPKNVEVFLTEYGKQNKETRVVIKTKFGDIKIRLYNDTPLHRANFIFLTKINYFSTTVFYRVAPNFVIQGGNSDNLQTRKFRNKYKNYLLPPEFRPHRKHKYGALAAARDWEGNPDKLSSPFEFYMIQNKKGGHHLDNEHTVFGEVISGFSTIDKIANLEAGLDEWPKKDVYMKVEILN
jgi:cyclophilin family peptidyl-prolyl cis-trans isomerase